MIVRILIGLAVMAFGFLIVWKTPAFQGFFGENAWAERVIGPGGTSTFYKLFGVGVSFLGMFIATNLISEILAGVVGLFVRS